MKKNPTTISWEKKNLFEPNNFFSFLTIYKTPVSISFFFLVRDNITTLYIYILYKSGNEHACVCVCTGGGSCGWGADRRCAATDGGPKYFSYIGVRGVQVQTDGKRSTTCLRQLKKRERMTTNFEQNVDFFYMNKWGLRKKREKKKSTKIELYI